MAKQKWQRRKRELKYTILCDWCGERKESSREDRKTCSGRCRQRLAAFVNTCGYAPDSAPGPVTAQHAIDLEILWLFKNESLRRQNARRLAGA